MDTPINTKKIRLVRCPRCKKLLPEMPEVPVYECGGCGTVLQAKNRKNDSKEPRPHFHETDPTEKNESPAVEIPTSTELNFHGDNEESSSPDQYLESENNFSFEQMSEKNQIEFQNHNRKNFSDEVPSSFDLSWHDHEFSEGSNYCFRSETFNSKDEFGPSITNSSPIYGRQTFEFQSSEEAKQEKIELLKMIYELQDQLERSRFSEGKGKGKGSYRAEFPWRESPRNSHYNNFPPEGGEMYYPGRFTGGKSWPEHSGVISRMAPPCSYSTEWFPHVISRDYRPETFSSLGEKCFSTKKKHFRPVAGGAPMIVCYYCFKLLQLPEDFILFNRKFHLLRCGSCSETLKFSVQNRTCLVPCFPDEQARAELVSCSDDYGQSLCRSCGSTNGNSSLEAMEESKEEDQKKKSNREKSSEIRPTAGSPLHRLMGYSSVSQVLK